MLKLSKESIKKIAINENVYYRGVRYYQNSTVSNVTWSKANKQYRGNVTGKNVYTVTIDVQDDYSFDYSCNCPAHVKYNGACKHVIATLLFIEDYIERSEIEQPNTPEEKQVLNIIEYFNKYDYNTIYGETFRFEVSIDIPSLLRANIGKSFISFHAGAGRLYKIQNIKKFISDYYNKKDIILGKEFKFIYGESQFEKNSMKIMSYLIEIFEIQESLGKVYYSNMFTKGEITFTKNMVIKLLECMGDDSFNLNLYGNSYKKVNYLRENPPIEFNIALEDDYLKMDIQGDKAAIPITEDGSLLYMEHTVYLPEQAFIKNYVPFYNYLGKDKEPLMFHGENKQKFLDTVLPQIQDTMQIIIPKEMQSRYIVTDLSISVYLDRYKNYIQGKVLFQYGEYKINPLNSQLKNGVIIVRQKEKERIFLDYLSELNFIPYKDTFIIKKENDIYGFLMDGINGLTTRSSIFYSDDFKNISIRQPSILNTSIRINSNSDLLEVDMSYEDIPREELKKLFHSLQLKKKYYRLKNGSFINLNHDNLNTVTSILDSLNISSKDMEDGVFALEKHYALYLDSLFEQEDNIVVEKEKSFNEFINAVLQPEKVNYSLPQGITASLREYQVRGYKWLKTLARYSLGGILADDMGLGKTLQTIVYIASCPEQLHLVVCPTSLVYNWQDEFLNFAPNLRTQVITGTPEERRSMICNNNNVDVFITSYPLIRRDIEEYMKVKFDTMFIDEAQFIKNPASLNAKSVKRVNASYKFALTGTPIENSLSELWSIFDYILPKYLLSHKAFIEEYEKPIIKDNSKDALEKLGKHIHPFLLRRMKKDVLTELPEKIETKLLTEMTEEQKKIYLSYMENIRQQMEESSNNKGIQNNQIQILAALTRLRQICCHPGTFIDNYHGGSGKLDLLMEQIPNYIANDHRILIFSQFTSMLDIIGVEFKKANIEYFSLKGNTKTADRIDYVKRFNQGEASVFLISLKAGGTGLNLTGADTVIHFDPWWNPAVEEQATDRAYRIGQKNVVHVVKLITKGTIEEKIYKLQKKKRELSDSIIESKEVFINKLTKEELEDIFK
jgi:SNF2 family DNA or RNA helicase